MPALSGPQVFDLLSSLVDKSLVVYEEDEHGQGRYRLLETVRQYARDRSVGSGEAQAARERHRAVFVRLAAEAQPQLCGPGQPHWLGRLEKEHDNIRAALDGSLSGAGGAEDALRIAGGVWRFWKVRAHGQEGYGWLTRALAAAPSAPPALRAEALGAAGVLAGDAGDLEAAQRLFEEALRLQRQEGDQPGVASSLDRLAMVASFHGDHAAARAHLEENLGVVRAGGDPGAIAWAVGHLGQVVRRQQGDAAARPYFEEALATARATGSAPLIAWPLRSLGWIAQGNGEWESAGRSFRDSLTLYREIGDKWSQVGLLDDLALLARLRGQPERATRLLAASEALARTLDPASQADQEEAAAVRVLLTAESFASAWVEGGTLTWEQAVAYAREEEEADEPA